MWATPSMLILLLYPGLHMQHIQTAHSPSPWITQMYSSQVLRAGKQDQSVSLWPYSLWLLEYMRLKNTAAQQRECVCMFVGIYACTRMYSSVCESTHWYRNNQLWCFGRLAVVLSSYRVNIPNTLTHQLDIPLARMFPRGIFNGEFAIFPQQRPISALPWLKCISKKQHKAIITLLEFKIVPYIQKVWRVQDDIVLLHNYMATGFSLHSYCISSDQGLKLKLLNPKMTAQVPSDWCF